MDASSVAFLQPTNPFCRVSSRRSHTPSSIPSRKNPLRRTMDSPILFIKIPSWNSFPVHSGRVLPISAHFRRPSRRRNTLREKLIVPNEAQVRGFSTPDSNLQNWIHSDDSYGKSNPLEKLENWVDQYKKDSGYYGTGSIFTVSRDADGNVSHVSVDTDEIAKRSRIGAWLTEEQEGMDLNSMLSRAKMTAKEFETGEYRLPRRNSSIAKFVAEVKNSSFVSGLRSISLQGEMLVNIFPQIGLTVLCTCCIFWAVKNMIMGGNGEPGPTREELEMLRRKKKSRMEREELEKGTVKVIKDSTGFPVESSSRPQLDRNDLMKSIIQTKASRENLLISDTSSNFETNNLEFVDKVRKIRQMARKAREIERQDRSEYDEKEDEDNTPSTYLAKEDKEVSIKSDEFIEVESVNSVSGHNSPSKFGSLANHPVVIKNKEMLIKNSVEGVNNTSDGESQKNFDTNNNIAPENVDDHEMDRKITLGADIVSVDVMINKEKVGKNEKSSTVVGEKESNTTLRETSVRKKPKIIRSVNEAREYLAEKRRTSTEKMQPNKKVQSKRLRRGKNSLDSICDDKLGNKANQIINNNPKVVGRSKLNKFQVDDTRSDKFSLDIEETKVRGDTHENFQYDIPDKQSEKPLSVDGVMHSSFLDDSESGKMIYSSNILLGDDAENSGSINGSRNLVMEDLVDEHKNILNQNRRDSSTCYTADNKQALESLSTSPDISSLANNSVRTTPEMMKQFKDDRVHHQELSDRSNKGGPYQEEPIRTCQDSIDFAITTEGSVVNKDRIKNIMEESSGSEPDLTSVPAISSEDSTSSGIDVPLPSERVSMSEDIEPSMLKSSLDNHEGEREQKSSSRSKPSFSQDSDRADCDAEAAPLNVENTWVERNFEQFNPIIKKIGIGFKENYVAAKEIVQEQPSLRPEISELGLMEEDGELEWMNDQSLREIVFQVRDNELAGRDPFHLMDAEDQQAFFKGLECKAEKVNEKLSGLHQWVHSRIENLDYGADGISLNDPLEKIIPRWKTPAVDQDPDFLGKFSRLQTGNGRNSHVVKEDTQISLKKSEELTSHPIPNSPVNGRITISPDGVPKNPKTLIECSDGSSKPGKKKGKEHWRHTKKWSQGFLEIYNAEKDPEIKSIMKDMGKGLDRWITDKERQDVADLMTRIPKRQRRYIEKKMDKLKREMEMFGPQAVVSKYKEYSDEKEEDYLWWLDLPFVLCIELYTIEDDTPKVGFYSLEMAADLELNPKQYHVIAFEDAGDSKNFCYIVQAHMDILGSGKAFVVARPPKDAFRESKANGFNVTVIRKNEIKLNVDLTLEEVEEEIAEIGSKMYHDKVMHERSVDIRALMKGVITADKSTKRKSKGKLTKPSKS